MLKIRTLFGLKKPKIVIGRLEDVNIPDLDLVGITAKIDTGAYRGTIHAENIREVENSEHEKVLEFTILDEDHPEFQNKIHRISNYKIVKVRSSQSGYEDRYAIPLMIELGGVKIKAELSLSSRKELRYPILIGRKALKKKFLVDVTKINT
jgi:hypothetical protein